VTVKVCPWNGQPCGECDSWPSPVNGKMPAKCEAKTPFLLLAMYIPRGQVSDEMTAKYKAWVAAGMPRLVPDEPETEDDDPLF
jgi:hypothetical protein